MRTNTALLLLALMAVSIKADFELVEKSFLGNDFADLDGWTAVNPYNKNTITACKDIKLAGGYGVFAAKSSLVKQFRLPPHYKVQLKVQIWKIDSWDNEKFYIYLDDKRVYDRSFAYNEGESLCGAGNSDWKEVRENLDLALAHNSNSATIVFTSTLDQDANDESWGIRDFQLLIERCPSQCDTCTGSDASQCASWKLTSWFWTDFTALGAQGWVVENGRDGGSQCAGVNLLGGFNLYGKGARIRNKLALPPHYRLKVKVNYWKIDSWDNERGSVSVDGKEIWGRNYGVADGYQNTICGANQPGWNQLSTPVEADLAHTGPSAEISITSNLDQPANDESWGVRDLFVYVSRCADNCDSCSGPNPEDCQKCSGNFALSGGKCQALLSFVLLESAFFDQGFKDLKGWKLTDNKQGDITQCGDTTLVGGFNVFGGKAAATKTFNLPPHKRLRIQVQLWKIDSWDDEVIFVTVDGGRVFEQRVGFANGGNQICGRQESNWNELIIDVDTIVVHKGDTAVVQISSTLDQGADDESWGFRNFRIFYESKPNCAVLYTECDFKGASFELCQDSPNFQTENIPPQIRSLKVPPQGKVTLYQQTQYGGRSVTYTENQECIQTFGFSSLEQMSATLHNNEEWALQEGPRLTNLRRIRT